MYGLCTALASRRTMTCVSSSILLSPHWITEDEAAAGAAAAGLRFYHNFRAVVNRTVLFDPDVSVRHIMRTLALHAHVGTTGTGAAAAAVSATSETVLGGIVESLLRSRKASSANGPTAASAPPPPGAVELHLSSFVAACRRHLHLLQPLVRGTSSSSGGGPQLESRLLLLRVLRLLLELDAARLLQPGPSLDFIMDCYCEALAPGSR